MYYLLIGIFIKNFFFSVSFDCQNNVFDDEVPIIVKHSIKQAEVKNWKGVFWADAKMTRPGLAVNYGLRLTDSNKINKAPVAIVTFSLFLVKNEKEKEKVRQFSLSPKWSRVGIDGGYHEIEYADDVTKVLRESKVKYNGSLGSWEMFFSDPLHMNYETGERLLVGKYSLDVEVILKDGSTLMFRNITFQVRR